MVQILPVLIIAKKKDPVFGYIQFSDSCSMFLYSFNMKYSLIFVFHEHGISGESGHLFWVCLMFSHD